MISFDNLVLQNYQYMCFFSLRSKIKPGAIVKLLYKKKTKNFAKYRISGICVAIKNNLINKSITLRNVVSLFGFQFSLPIYSPKMTLVARRLSKKLFKYNHSKLYYLKYKDAVHSRVPFNYVLERI